MLIVTTICQSKLIITTICVDIFEADLLQNSNSSFDENICLFWNDRAIETNFGTFVLHLQGTNTARTQSIGDFGSFKQW